MGAFGPVTEGGYGIGYIVYPTWVGVAISAFKVIFKKHSNDDNHNITEISISFKIWLSSEYLKNVYFLNIN